MFDKCMNELLQFRPVHIQLSNRIHRLLLVGAGILLLAGREFAIDQQPVLQVVNPQLGRFGEADCA